MGDPVYLYIAVGATIQISILIDLVDLRVSKAKAFQVLHSFDHESFGEETIGGSASYSLSSASSSFSKCAI